MKKILVLGIAVLLILVTLTGCDEENGNSILKEIPEAVFIYSSMMELYRDITDDVPLLVIKDKDGIELFWNLIRNSQRLPGILDVTASPFVAKIEYQTSAEVIDLALFFPTKAECLDITTVCL